jgi:hypothetical protein
MALGSAQPLTEMSTRNLPGRKRRPEEGWQPHRHLWADYAENVTASTSHNPMDLHGLIQGHGQLHLFFHEVACTSCTKCDALWSVRFMDVTILNIEVCKTRQSWLAISKGLGQSAEPDVGTKGRTVLRRKLPSADVDWRLSVLCWATARSGYTRKIIGLWCILTHAASHSYFGSTILWCWEIFRCPKAIYGVKRLCN